MTVSPGNITIIWIAINVIGMLVCAWLTLISWERRIATMASSEMLLGKQDRIRIATKHMVDRFARFIFFLVAVISGIIRLSGVEIPYVTVAYLLVFMVVITLVVSVFDLFGELRKR